MPIGVLFNKPQQVVRGDATIFHDLGGDLISGLDPLRPFIDLFQVVPISAARVCFIAVVLVFLRYSSPVTADSRGTAAGYVLR